MAAGPAGGPTVVMPIGAAASGEAFELLSSCYLSDACGLEHLAAPFYTRLGRGRWVQFDGLFRRADQRQLVLEAKFYDAPVGLATPGIAARVTFAAEVGVDGVIFCSRRGFAGDILRARMPGEKVLLSWAGMRKNLSRWRNTLVTAGLDPVERVPGGYAAASGATLVTAEAPLAGRAGEGFAFLPSVIERWLRRMPASPVDVSPLDPPRRYAPAASLDVLSAWTIEDGLRGFAPTSPQLLVAAINALLDGPLDLPGAWRATWRRGYRGRKGGLKNALDDLCIMGVAQKFHATGALFYGLRGEGEGSWRDPEETLARALARWPAYRYFRQYCGPGDKHARSARLSGGFAHLFPYARSLYNPAKVAGFMALERHFEPSVSSVNPS